MVHSFYHHDGTVDGEIKMLELKCWKTCPDLKTLFSMNQQYLAGDLQIHPAVGHAFENECKLITGSLREMHEHAMFTFLTQRRKECAIIAPHKHNEPRPDPSSTTEAWCRCCSNGHCFAAPGLWSQLRALPFVQFCVPMERESCVERNTALRLIEALLRDSRLHITISWPKSMPVSMAFETCTVASTMLAKTYIPEEDLEEYFHYKSRLGNTRTHEIRQGVFKRALSWQSYEPVQWKWSQVNDYHLLRPRVPEFFLGRESRNVVIGVNCVDYDSWIENLPELILRRAKEAGFTNVFPRKPEAGIFAEGVRYAAYGELSKVSERHGVKEKPGMDAKDGEEVEAMSRLEGVAMRTFD